MSPKTRRSILQVLFLLLVFLSVAASDPRDGDFIGCVIDCICASRTGSDHVKKPCPETQGDHFTPNQDGDLVLRYHDFSMSDFTLTGKDLDYVRDWLPGNVIVGLHIPTAPGASQPGSLADAEHKLWLWSDPNRESYEVPLVEDDEVATKIANVIPPESGAHWKALVPANDEYLTFIPTETSDFEGIWGHLFYALDFHGADPCNGCTVKLVFCTPTNSLPQEYLSRNALVRSALESLHWNSDECLTCTDPIPTVIRITDNQGNPLPSPPTAWLSPWGGPVLTSLYGLEVTLEYALGHSLPEAKTFNLEPIQSEKGWTYNWYDLDDNPITQMVVAADVDPWTTNVKVLGTIPANAQDFDTVHLTATCASDPSLKAEATSIVGGFPDPEQNTVADVGITKTADAETIEAGESVEYTLTVSNYEESAIHVVITDTLSPAWIISDVTLPQGCERTGGQIVCQVANVPADGSRVLSYTVHTVERLGAILSNSAEVQPKDGVDLRFYDNHTGPVEVVVEGEGSTLFLPIISKP